MPKQKKKATRASKKDNPVDRLAKALMKRTKAELVNVIVEMARDDRNVLRQLELQFGVDAPPSELVAATRQAIEDATDFDERETNYNFDYDSQAYSMVERNFDRLIKLGHLREAMALSLDLMERGSYQVEMSDEGMMTDDIEACLEVVIKALSMGPVPAVDVVKWCKAVTKKDGVGFICDRSIQALRKRFESS